MATSLFRSASKQHAPVQDMLSRARPEYTARSRERPVRICPFLLTNIVRQVGLAAASATNCTASVLQQDRPQQRTDRLGFRFSDAYTRLRSTCSLAKQRPGLLQLVEAPPILVGRGWSAGDELGRLLNLVAYSLEKYSGMKFKRRPHHFALDVAAAVRFSHVKDVRHGFRIPPPTHFETRATPVAVPGGRSLLCWPFRRACRRPWPRRFRSCSVDSRD